MTALLTAAAIVTTVTLLISATRTAATATASDPHKRGPWGIVLLTSQRGRRPLNPHERRWQTTLVTGKENSSRWDTVVNEIAVLENLLDIDPSSTPPTAHSHQWIEASIANLEASISDSTTPGDPAK